MDFNIPSECLGLCSSNSKIDLPHCSMFAAKAVACMIRGHESAPPAPGPIHYENLSHRSIKVYSLNPFFLLFLHKTHYASF